MGSPGLSFKNRLFLLQEEFRDAVVGITMFCALAIGPVIPTLMRPANPIIGTQQVSGIVEYVTTMPLNPKTAVGQGLHYRYEVRLINNNALIFVDGELETPHMLGSQVSIEQQHRQDGTDTYRLL